MLYLLDADTLITGDRRAYPLHRFPIFWDWLIYQGQRNRVKVSQEQFEEVTVGKGTLVDWLSDEVAKNALLLQEDLDPALVNETTLVGYGALDEQGLEQVGRDPFLVSYARLDVPNRTVVTFEVSKPSKQGANRKLPDICGQFGVPCCNLFDLIDALDFSTTWTP